MKPTREQVAAVLDFDPATGTFRWKVAKKGIRVGSIAGTEDPRGYIRIGIDGQRLWAHQLAWLMVYGVWPENDVDHINGIKGDNAIANLRDATRSLNLHNRPAAARGTSGAKGITWHKKAGKWAAQIVVNYQRYHLGLFSDFDAACRARAEAETRFQVETRR